MQAFLLFAAILLALPAEAHELWLEREGGAYVLLQGHRHGSHEGTETVPYDSSKVAEALCLTEDGKLRSPIVERTQPARVQAQCAGLLVRYVSGFWTKTAWETRNTPRTGLTGVLKSWHSEESVKRIDRWFPPLAAPLGAGLEISPAEDPFRVGIGGKLTIAVTQGGKPVVGAPVAYRGEARGITDASGRIAIRLRHPGVQLISVSTETPLADGKADTALRTASLQFDLAK